MSGGLEGWDNSYKRVGRKRGKVYYRVEIYTDDDDSVTDIVPLDATERSDLGKDIIEQALAEWAAENDATVTGWRVTESMTCGVGGVEDPPEINPRERDADESDPPHPGTHPAREEKDFEDLALDISEGETIAYYPAGNPSVYGAKEATVVGVGPGPKGQKCVIVRDGSEKKRVPLEWLASVQE